MTGLMYYRPEDHIDYLRECLLQVRENGIDSVRWNIFLDQHRKSKEPLPPISADSPENGKARLVPREPTFLRGKHFAVWKLTTY